jgi:hypothetical protein
MTASGFAHDSQGACVGATRWRCAACYRAVRSSGPRGASKQVAFSISAKKLAAGHPGAQLCCGGCTYLSVSARDSRAVVPYAMAKSPFPSWPCRMPNSLESCNMKI